MKFLTKTPDSEILNAQLSYGGNHTRRLLLALLREQKSFCAYTEKYIPIHNDEYLEAVDVEHFNYAKKGTEEDDYYNWYAVLHRVNMKKSDRKFTDAGFHQSLFFQDREELNGRIEYNTDENLYFETDIDDTEACELIEFLQINSFIVAKRRENHLRKIKEIYRIKGSRENFVE